MNDCVWDIEWLAKSWQEDNSLNRINISCDKNKLCFFLFDKVGDMVETEFKIYGSLSFLGLFVFNLLLGCSSESVGFFFSGFRWVFSEYLEELRSYFNYLLLVALSRGLKNWAIAAGTLSLLNKILFFLWSWTYLGHLTNLALTILGLIEFPNLKFFFWDWLKGCFSAIFLTWDWV